MFYTIYKTTNKINGKIYIGKHQTKDINDCYVGSGKHLNYAIKKYGIENFEKEILFVFETEEEMNAKEAELVTEDFVKEDTNYNLCPGGKGGFGYLNNEYWVGEKLEDRRILVARKLKGNSNCILSGRKNGSFNMKQAHLEGKIKYDTFTGKKHTTETKIKISQSVSKSKKGTNCGSLNSQFGTMWITDGKENKKIDKSDLIPEGWTKGRIFLYET